MNKEEEGIGIIRNVKNGKGPEVQQRVMENVITVDLPEASCPRPWT